MVEQYDGRKQTSEAEPYCCTTTDACSAHLMDDLTRLSTAPIVEVTVYSPALFFSACLPALVEYALLCGLCFFKAVCGHFID